MSNSLLPLDHERAVLVGRVWDPVTRSPRVVRVTESEVLDIGDEWRTVSELTESRSPATSALASPARPLGSTSAVLADSEATRRGPDVTHFLSPLDLHCVKASGVTFVASLLERVVEEASHGSATLAGSARTEIQQTLGSGLSGLRAGSPDALRLLGVLTEKGLWSQYLEVGLGVDAEIFTKCPVLSTVGTGDQIGVLRSASWSNSEPEVVLIVSSRGESIGATLGNDMNLRDVEGRSALLLGRAKDNNASGAVGPLIRLFDDGFGLGAVRDAEVTMTIRGRDGYVLADTSNLRDMSRDPADLVDQLMGAHHQYPDGVALFLGTPFAPTADRDQPGLGFTHRPGDVVSIASPRLGTLVNEVQYSEDCRRWEFGLSALLRCLATRGAA